MAMSITDISLNLYRKTVKRFHSAHRATHWVMNHATIPLLEGVTGFHTIPDDPFWFRLELLTRRHEPETIHLLDQLIKPGMTMLDIGAHVGYYSRRYAPKIGGHGLVFAFEPHPRTFAMLGQNVAKMPNVMPVQAALAEEAGTAVLHDYLMMSASGSLHYDEAMVELQQAQTQAGDVAPRMAEAFEPQTFTVETMPGDTFLSNQGIHQVDIIKMDIEGAEINALRGLKQTIANSPNLQLIMEYNPAALTAFDLEPLAAMAEVQALGFTTMEAIEVDGRLTDLTGDNGALQQLTDNLMSHMGVVNLRLARQQV